LSFDSRKFDLLPVLLEDADEVLLSSSPKGSETLPLPLLVCW
jgi:hypothetical protein